jgi:succinate dehydrogenase / fumarate reductase flavoprotein subunit
MRVFPAVHYSMGGLWVDFNQMSNISGLFAAGECEYQYHGANRLGANSLVSCIYGGLVAGPAAVKYSKGLAKAADAVESSVYDDAVRREIEKNSKLLSAAGKTNPHVLHEELGDGMTESVTVVRYNAKLKKMDDKIQELIERYKDIHLPDTGTWSNRELVFARELENMLQLARVITLGAWRRNESRGAHYKPEFPDRNDDNWLKTTKAKFRSEEPEFSYEDVDIQHIKPRPRKYDMK